MNGKVGQECSGNIIYLIVLGPIKQLLLSLIIFGPIKNNYRWVWLLCSHLEQLSSPQTWKLCHNLSALCKNRKQLMIHDGALTQYTSGASLPDCFSLAFDNISSNFGKCSQISNKFQNQCFSWYTNQCTWTEFHKYWQRELVETVKQYSHWICKTIASIAWRPSLSIVAMFLASVPISWDMFVSDCDQISIFFIILFLNNWDINGCFGQNDHFSLSSFSFSFRTSIWTGSNGTEKENKILQIKFLIGIFFKKFIDL